MILIKKIPEKLLLVTIFISLIVLEYFNFDINWDLAMQLNTLINFTNGHGITINNIDESGKLVYEHCSSWPGGFVIFLYPIYLMTKSTITSALTIRCIAYLFFILFLLKYLNFLKLESVKRKWVLIYFITGVIPFISFNPSDVLATVFCLWGFYFHLKFQNNQYKKYLLISLLLLSMGYFVKYVFLPFMFYPIFSFILKEKEKVFENFKKGSLIFFLTISFTALIYLINVLLVGKPSGEFHFDAFRGQAHWSQLSHFDGFLMSVGGYKRNWMQSFIGRGFPIQFAKPGALISLILCFGLICYVYKKNENGIQPLSLFTILFPTGLLISFFLGIGFPIQFGKLSAMVTLVMYVVFFYYFFINKKNITNSILTDSLNISFSAGFLICVFLGFMSVNILAQTWWINPYWTYVEETRYYGPIIFFGLLNILILALCNKKFTFLYLLLLFMFSFNATIYSMVIKNASSAQNYTSYSNNRDRLLLSIIFFKSSKNTLIVYDDPSNRYNSTHNFLQSQGFILIDKQRFNIQKSLLNEYNVYFLIKQEKNNTYILTPDS